MGLRLCVLFLMLTVLTGCNVGSTRDIQLRDGGIAVGNRVALHQRLDVPGESTRIFMQRGIVLADGFDQYYPHCNFEVRTRQEVARPILPDEFLIVRISEGFEEVVGLDNIKLASLGLNPLFEYDYLQVSRYIHLYLGSDRQPDVMRLTCHGAFDDMPYAELPTVTEIREALGKVATLRFGVMERLEPGHF